MSGFENTFEDKDLSDKQIDTSDLELNLGGYQAVMWYGIISIIYATVALVVYMLGNGNAVIRTYW